MSDRPNILFIFDDQHRYDFLGAAGADFINTPNIDRLAERGVRFSQCVTNCPVCAPARIGLAAGLQPCTIGSLDNHSYLPRSAMTYYQRLRDHGYRVGCVGKLDLAKPDSYNGRHGDRPCVFGWGFTHPEECEGKMHAGSSPTPLGPYGFWLEEQGLYEAFYEDYQRRRKTGWVKDASHDSVLPTEAFEESYIARHAVEWLEQVDDDFPWHYFVSFVGPHDPFDPPTEYAKRYRGAEMPPAIEDSLEDKPEWVRRQRLDLSDDEVAVTRRQYCAIIELIDDAVGRMVDVLQRRGLLENTVIVFASDHGEMLGDHGLYKKSLPYEAAVRVPLVMAGPGVEPADASGALVELIDLNPTLCELAGLPPQEGIEARSFASVLRGEAVEHRAEAVSAIRQFRLIRTRTHKLIEHYNAGLELFDLESDPEERHNVADEDRARARELRRRMVARYNERKWRR
ncbi:MAG: sulfatase [Planctomycetota bacterium]